MTESNHSAFVNDHVEPSVDFDYDAIDRGNPLVAELEGAKKIPDLADAFDEILLWCWNHGKVKSDLKSSFIRFVALTAAMRPETFENRSYEEIGKELKVTKAWMSKLALEFQDKFGVHFRRSRRQGTRAIFRRVRKQNATKKSHATRH